MTRTLALLLLAVSAAHAQRGWTVSPRPTLDIGDESNTQTQFNGVTAVMQMPRGEIVVANGMSQEIRVFSAAGAYVRTLGAPTTPLRAVGRLWRSGDTIIAAEVLPGESNVHHFSPTAWLARHSVGASNAGGVSPLDRFPDGRYVVTAARRFGRSASAGTVFVDSMPLGVLSLDDRARPEWIGALVRESIVVPGFSGRGRGSPNIVRYNFGREQVHAVSGGRLWVGDTQTGTVHQYDSQGNRVGQFTVPIAERPLDTLAIRKARATMLDDAMNWSDRARIDASFAVPLPRAAPRFTRFIPGVDGEMWLELFSENPTAPRAFVVLDRAGRAAGRITLPPQMTPFEIGPDYILGVRRDPEGLERIVRHTLTRR